MPEVKKESLICANFMDQKAIDEALKKHNKDLGENLYQEGTNRCLQCDYGLGLETDPIVRLIRDTTGRPIKRVCFKEATHAKS